jgi:hypothetical protein
MKKHLNSGSKYNVHCRCKKENALPMPTDEATLNQMLMVKCSLQIQKKGNTVALPTHEATLKQKLTIKCSLQTKINARTS